MDDLSVTNSLICAIEKMYRFDYKRKKRLRAIPLVSIREIMRKYYIGLSCSKCRYGTRYCCDAHRAYYLRIWALMDWQWASRRHFPQSALKMRVCAICGLPIPYPATDLKYSLSVDHIRPLSKGGLEFDRTNMQPAHFGCNSRKGGRVAH